MTRQCDICHEINSGENWCFKLSDDKESREMNGHESCIHSIYSQFKSIKDHSKKSVKICLRELKLKE